MNSIRFECLFKVDTPKVRIVVIDCLQVPGVDHIEIFAPVVKINSIRILISTVAVMVVNTSQMNVITALLNLDLDGDSYMEVTHGFKDPKRSDLL